jgi:ABC-type nickel/cobalt efflux system permease component RcnA
MKQHNHEHSGLRAHTAEHRKKPHGRQLHKDWRTWMAVALMLVAIFIYVLTLDESMVPIEQPETGSQAPSQP